MLASEETGADLAETRARRDRPFKRLVAKPVWQLTRQDKNGPRQKLGQPVAGRGAVPETDRLLLSPLNLERFVFVKRGRTAEPEIMSDPVTAKGGVGHRERLVKLPI